MQNASEILGIGEGEALRLFPGTAQEIRRRYHQLVREWHPDHNRDPMAQDVIRHINILHDIRLNGGTAARGVASTLTRSWKKEDGSETVVKARSIRTGPLGDVIVTGRTVAYETVAGYEDVADAEGRAVGSLTFANEAMRADVGRFLPVFKRRIDAIGKTVNVFERPGDTVLLADLAIHMGGSVPPVHVAWIVSCLENMACYLHWAGLSHGAIAAETVLVCPERHGIVLVGGWGFATRYGNRPIALPQRTLSLVPRLEVKGEVVDPTVDLMLVRALARELLGASGAGGLAGVADLPEPMRRWLTLPPMENAFLDYASWEKCLAESFGPRKFVRLGVKPDDVYKPQSKEN